MRPQATFSFVIFFTIFSFFYSLRRSFLFVAPSSSSLFPHRPALSKSFRIRKSPFFINFDESITDQPTNRPTDRRTRPLIEMRTHLKRKENNIFEQISASLHLDSMLKVCGRFAWVLNVEGIEGDCCCCFW